MSGPRARRAPEVFATFLRLGLTSFGGPVAHIGYFRRELVQRRGWVGEAQFAEMAAIAQFLPGPASSQLGFALGLVRGGWAGALAAFAAFTLPSALLLYGFARALPAVPPALAATLVHGLKLAAVAVVAQAVLGMARALCPDAPRASIATVAAMATLVLGGGLVQLGVVAFGALAGLALFGDVPMPRREPLALPHGPRTGVALALAYALLLALLPAAAHALDGLAATASAFYRAGALVFGGGHVVLPLLRDTVVRPGWIGEADFLAGYGAAQAVPGPMFTLAAFLGERMPHAMGGAPGAAVALAAIFAPGLTLMAAALPLWARVSRHPAASRVVSGINAAVVGLLGAALYDPVWTGAIGAPADVAIAAAAFTLLVAWRASALWAVAWCVAASALAAGGG